MTTPVDPHPSFDDLRAEMPATVDLHPVADVFSLLGDPARLRVLVALSARSLRVRELAEVTGSSESSVSHALRLLRAHRVVAVERHGREAHYRLADSHVRALLELALDHAEHSVPLHEVGDAHPSSEPTCGAS